MLPVERVQSNEQASPCGAHLEGALRDLAATLISGLEMLKSSRRSTPASHIRPMMAST